MRDNKSYYDTFSETYDAPRDHGYHRYLDEAEVAVAQPWVTGKEVLEVGCGTGLILERLSRVAERAVGVDLSPGMLEHARARGLDVHEGSATALPFEDASFDAAVSFKVLAHVEDISVAMGEMGRVVRPGGRVIAEFYNRKSVRALVKSIVSPGSIGKDGSTDESDVFTRFDTISDIAAYLPENLKLVHVDGIRVISPAALLFNLPVLGALWSGIERVASKTPLKHLGGFLIVHCERV
jgi:SAM-dependent methyltransferase